MKRNLILIAIIFLTSGIMYAQVSVNTDNSPPDGSAMLDVKSTNTGMLVPRMWRSQRNAITSPATGLIIYQTNKNPGFYFYNGTSWEAIGNESIAINDLLDGKTGGQSIFLGPGAGLLDDGTDNRNVGIGDSVLAATFEGTDNTAVGYRALKSNLYYGNTAIGAYALMKSYHGDDNTATGAWALANNTTGYKNTALGRSAMENITNTADNTAVGAWALNYNNTGFGNTAIGEGASQLNQTGSFNTSLGQSADWYNQHGSNNTMIGWAAGAGTTNHSKSGNVFIGYRAGYKEHGSNKLYIENSDTTRPLIFGEFDNDRVVINGNSTDNINNRTFFSNGPAGGTTVWNVDSDQRLKKNIETIQSPLDKILHLRGVNYEWAETEHHPDGLQMGFVAQEVEEIIPEVVDNADGRYSMQYSPITALLVEAVKEQQKMIEELQKEIEQLKKQSQ